MARLGRALAAVLLAAAWACGTAPAHDVALPALFGEHMVLQRDAPLPVWGTARPGGRVVVRLAGQECSTTVAADGAWALRLDPLPAGGPYELVVAGENEVRIPDVLVGEVWLASGQSNMEMPVAGWGRVRDWEAEVAAADHPGIRLFQVRRATAEHPRTDVESDGWQAATPESVAGFSAVAYFFGRRLREELGVPIGLVHSSWGGTVAEAWTSPETLAGMDDFREALRAVQNITAADREAQRRAYDEALAARLAAFAGDDPGRPGGEPLWAAPDLDDSSWEIMLLPTQWEPAGLDGMDGVVWFRRAVEVPAGWMGSDLTLSLGPVDDADETYWNGALVGSTDGWDTPRRYRVPAALIRKGRNVLTVRVRDDRYGGGLWGSGPELALEGPEDAAIPLAGPWLYKVGIDSREMPPLPPSPDDPNRPSVLYNAMLRPLAPFALRGVIWYQGESNTERAEQYRTLFPAMIRDWRRAWGQPSLPFYFVQLANYLPAVDEPGDSSWAELREAQRETLALPDTGMAVTVDIGEADNVHPKNKQEVGARLARIALHRLYGEDVVDSGPLFREMQPEGDRLRLLFDHVDGGLQVHGETLAGFAVAGEDRHFHWAEATIDGDAVVVHSDAVPAPVAARYGWADNPPSTLYNAAGLPASPFRTDAWPGITGH